MGFFKQLGKVVTRTATLPVAVVADVVTFGGLNTDQDEPYTTKTAKKLLKDIERLPDSVDEENSP